ncbi:hypothetical protein SDRG_07896 [Saprolegnia diclina VS20]|uniref:Golgin-84 n=1 Tax=Saprolegnia diclina (strain VS20) TaxID=1156394 RepID=T0QIN0_SAPDV|nr:hypothetical protein SDRG_07896 [Saprolegnia diclina VS20]EQC34571.1 hypothetical protein SDRG_07896 [Saprolegnia diclina VS20]|eukprot:XP_008611977.1 hypothetical protein SDRG_07896 [Saprolegnia diclina VS20]
MASWLSTSLQRAGELLESVDQKAAGKLKPIAEDRLRKSRHDEAGADETRMNEADARSESGFGPRALSHASLAPASALGEVPESDSYSEWSEVENESNSGLIMEDMPLSSSSSRSLAPLHSPPSRGPDLPLSKNETTRLRKENAKLKADLVAVERHLATSHERYRVCEDELDALDKECTAKITSLETEIATLKQEKASDEEGFTTALAMKDGHIQAIQADLDRAKTAHAAQQADLDAVRHALAEIRNNKDQAWTQAASGEARVHEQLLSAQVELKEAQTLIASLKKDHADAKQSMYARQCQLEATNAQLTQDVAALERQLGDKSTTVATLHPAPVHAELQQTAHALAAAKKALYEETRKAQLHEQEVATFRRELTLLQGTLLEKDRQHTEALQTALKQATKPSPVVAVEPRRSSSIADDDVAHKSQLQAMTHRLLEKQEQLDGLRGRYASLEMRFNELRAHKETSLDLEAGRKRGLPVYQNTHRPQHNRVLNAVGAVDKQLFLFGRFLRAYPAARVACVCYLVLLHLWAFVILSFHTSHLNDEMLHQKATPSK